MSEKKGNRETITSREFPPNRFGLANIDIMLDMADSEVTITPFDKEVFHMEFTDRELVIGVKDSEEILFIESRWKNADSVNKERFEFQGDKPIGYSTEDYSSSSWPEKVKGKILDSKKYIKSLGSQIPKATDSVTRCVQMIESHARSVTL